MAEQDGKIWFGTARKAQWVKAPLADMGASGNGFSEEQQFNNGGQFVNASFGSARNFDMSWMGDRSELQVIKDYKDGIYGGGLIYWEDPFAKNILPPHWAAPMLSVRDWPSLIQSGNKPEPVMFPSADNGYPYQGAKYTVTNTEETSRSATLLIPEGHELGVGFVWTATGTAKLWCAPILTDGTEDTHIELTQVLDSGTSRVVDYFSNTSSATTRYIAVRIYIARTDSTPSTITIHGGMAILNPTEAPHPHPAFTNSDPWSSGEGFSGCVISTVPSMSYKGLVDGRRLINMSANLKEIGAWL